MQLTAATLAISTNLFESQSAESKRLMIGCVTIFVVLDVFVAMLLQFYYQLRIVTVDADFLRVDAVEKECANSTTYRLANKPISSIRHAVSVKSGLTLQALISCLRILAL